MNNKFYKMPREKRDVIINAGFEVFSKNSYKKSPMQEIASSAGISKSLLFHYFDNKKEYYLFLYDYAVNYIFEKLNDAGVFHITDFFELYRVSLTEKCKIYRQYRYLNEFIIKAYFEEEENLQEELQKRRSIMLSQNIKTILSRIDTYKFREGIDIELVIQVSIWTADGFLREFIARDSLKIDILEDKFIRLIEFWRKSYYKEEYLWRI